MTAPVVLRRGTTTTSRPETLPAKAARYLAEGRVIVARVEGEVVIASVEGSRSAIHVVQHRRGGWSCSCPAGQHGHRCAHAVAVGLVTPPGRSNPARRPERPDTSQTSEEIA